MSRLFTELYQHHSRLAHSAIQIPGQQDHFIALAEKRSSDLSHAQGFSVGTFKVNFASCSVSCHLFPSWHFEIDFKDDDWHNETCVLKMISFPHCFTSVMMSKYVFVLFVLLETDTVAVLWHVHCKVTHIVITILLLLMHSHSHNMAIAAASKLCTVSVTSVNCNLDLNHNPQPASGTHAVLYL